MFHGREYSRLWLTFDVDRTGFIRVDQVDPMLIVRIAVPIIAFRVPIIALRVPIIAFRVPIIALRVPIIALRVPIIALRVPIIALRVLMALSNPTRSIRCLRKCRSRLAKLDRCAALQNHTTLDQTASLTKPPHPERRLYTTLPHPERRLYTTPPHLPHSTERAVVCCGSITTGSYDLWRGTDDERKMALL